MQLSPELPRATVEVAHRRDAGGGFQLITIDLGEHPAVARSHLAPGQYVWLEMSGEGGYFALANRPGDAAWQLVVLPDRRASALLALSVPGARLSLTCAIGSGYPCDALRGQPVVIAMPVAAIAAARSVVLRRIDDADSARTTLLLGARTRAEVPLGDELLGFRASGTEVTVCLSREAAGGEPGYADGYVQAVASARRTAAAATYLVAGRTRAEAPVGEMAAALGARVYANY